MIKAIFIIFSILLLIYMVWPAPQQVSEFPPLPSSEKSQLEGDTTQIPNVSAYFSNNYRNFIVPFYQDHYRNLVGLPFLPLKLNYPPEHSWIAIKRHTDSTFIEELVFPLRDSLYVNGFEPFYEDGMPKFWGATKFEVGSNVWETKTTLRFYPSPLWARVLSWVGIVLSILFIYKLGRKIIF